MKLEVLFSKAKGFSIASEGIMLVERNNFSHASFRYLDTRTGQVMIYEASHGEVHEMLFSEWEKHNKIIHIVTYNISETKLNFIIRIFNLYKQVKYGFIQIVGIFLFYTIGIRRNIFSDGQSSFFCSELVAYILKRLGMLDTNIPLELIGPKKLYELIK